MSNPIRHMLLKDMFGLVLVATPGSIGLACWLSLLVLSITSTGCSSSHEDRQQAALRSFGTNETVEAKATTYQDQFIVRRQDGSIWEVRVKTDVYPPPPVSYKNCLYDPLYRLPPKPLPPVIPPLPLEREDTNEETQILSD